jgi:hypothetical protein
MIALYLSLALIGLGGPESGPAADKAVPNLKVLIVPDVGVEPEEITSKRKDRPTVYVFIPKEKFDRAMARFLRSVDEKLEEIHEGKMVVVWLTKDEVETSADYLQRAQKSLNLQRTLWTIYKGEAADVPDWELNPDALATAVAARKQKVVKSLGYSALNETDAPDVIKLLK